MVVQVGSKTLLFQQAFLERGQGFFRQFYDLAAGAALEMMVVAFLGMVVNVGAVDLGLDRQSQALQKFEGAVYRRAVDSLNFVLDLLVDGVGGQVGAFTVENIEYDPPLRGEAVALGFEDLIATHRYCDSLQ